MAYRQCEVALPLLIAGCIPFHRSLGPVACPPAAPPPAASAHVQLDGKGWGPVVHAPYSIVLDDRVEATVVSEGDSLTAQRVWAKLDLNTIKAVEVLRGPAAHERYPAATGDVIAVTRCYKSRSRGVGLIRTVKLTR